MPLYMMILHIVGDAGFALYPALSTLFLRWNCKTDKSNVSASFGWWFYPSVPAAILSPWITIDAKVLELSKRWSARWSHVMILGMGVLLFVPVLRNAKEVTPGVIFPPFVYLVMSFRVSLWDSLSRLSVGWSIIGGVYAVFARNVPVAFSAFTDRSIGGTGLPLLEVLNTTNFGVLYIAVGLVCSSFGIWSLRVTDGPRDHLIELFMEEYERSRVSNTESNLQEEAEGSVLPMRIP
jgi:hypothetical protein